MVFNVICYNLFRSSQTNSKAGVPVILPSSFIGGDRNMAKNYLDSLEMTRSIGKPDLFITMTCNPKWQEITENLMEGQKPEDRPDIVTRVFNLKLKSALEEIVTYGIFGKLLYFM